MLQGQCLPRPFRCGSVLHACAFLGLFRPLTPPAALQTPGCLASAPGKPRRASSGVARLGRLSVEGEMHIHPLGRRPARAHRGIAAGAIAVFDQVARERRRRRRWKSWERWCRRGSTFVVIEGAVVSQTAVDPLCLTPAAGTRGCELQPVDNNWKGSTALSWGRPGAGLTMGVPTTADLYRCGRRAT